MWRSRSWCGRMSGPAEAIDAAAASQPRDGHATRGAPLVKPAFFALDRIARQSGCQRRAHWRQRLLERLAPRLCRAGGALCGARQCRAQAFSLATCASFEHRSDPSRLRLCDARDPPRLPGPRDRMGFADKRHGILRLFGGLAAAWAGAARVWRVADVQGGASGLGLLRHRDDAQGFRVRSGGARRRAEGALLPRTRRRADRHRPGLSARRLRASATADLIVLTASAVGATPVASLKGVAARGLAGKPVPRALIRDAAAAHPAAPMRPRQTPMANTMAPPMTT